MRPLICRRYDSSIRYGLLRLHSLIADVLSTAEQPEGTERKEMAGSKSSKARDHQAQAGDGEVPLLLDEEAASLIENNGTGSKVRPHMLVHLSGSRIPFKLSVRA